MSMVWFVKRRSTYRLQRDILVAAVGFQRAVGTCAMAASADETSMIAEINALSVPGHGRAESSLVEPHSASAKSPSSDEPATPAAAAESLRLPVPSPPSVITDNPILDVEESLPSGESSSAAGTSRAQPAVKRAGSGEPQSASKREKKNAARRKSPAGTRKPNKPQAYLMFVRQQFPSFPQVTCECQPGRCSPSCVCGDGPDVAAHRATEGRRKALGRRTKKGRDHPTLGKC